MNRSCVCMESQVMIRRVTIQNDGYTCPSCGGYVYRFPIVPDPQVNVRCVDSVANMPQECGEQPIAGTE